MNITTGSKIKVQLTLLPTNEAARKTLVRLFRKDAGVARHQEHQQRKRPSWQEWRRGNATWHHQMRTCPALELKIGASYEFLASVDVARDLQSVKRFVSVTPA